MATEKTTKRHVFTTWVERDKLHGLLDQARREATEAKETRNRVMAELEKTESELAKLRTRFDAMHDHVNAMIRTGGKLQERDTELTAEIAKLRERAKIAAEQREADAIYIRKSDKEYNHERTIATVLRGLILDAIAGRRV